MVLDKNRKNKLREKSGGLCAKCCQHFPISKLTIDHIIPSSLTNRLGFVDWGNDESNLQILCQQCNKKKGADLDFTNPKTLPLLKKIFERIEFLHGATPPRKKNVYHSYRTLTVKSDETVTYWWSNAKHEQYLKSIYKKQTGELLPW